MTSPSVPIADRLFARAVLRPNGCREWTGAHTDKGYGMLRVKGKLVLTHRLAWTLAHGPIPPGIEVLHHCDNPPCCEPYGNDHLFLGTHAENMADMAKKDRGTGGAMRCKNGHLYSDANTYIRPNEYRDLSHMSS